MKDAPKDFKSVKQRLDSVIGKNIFIKINRGRNKFATVEGCIENLYPAVFTLRSTDGELKTFSYADILSNNILFYKTKPS